MWDIDGTAAARGRIQTDGPGGEI